MDAEKSKRWKQALWTELNHLEDLEREFPDDVTIKRLARQVMVCIMYQDYCEPPEWHDHRTIG